MHSSLYFKEDIAKETEGIILFYTTDIKEINLWVINYCLQNKFLEIIFLIYKLISKIDVFFILTIEQEDSYLQSNGEREVFYL